ncbi:hypothetical protein ES703_24869 [subsurface metagenome]
MELWKILIVIVATIIFLLVILKIFSKKKKKKKNWSVIERISAGEGSGGFFAVHKTTGQQTSIFPTEKELRRALFPNARSKT